MNITVKKRKERAAHARLKPDESQRVRADHVRATSVAPTSPLTPVHPDPTSRNRK
jgi:hypothetical protein